MTFILNVWSINRIEIPDFVPSSPHHIHNMVPNHVSAVVDILAPVLLLGHDFVYS